MKMLCMMIVFCFSNVSMSGYAEFFDSPENTAREFAPQNKKKTFSEHESPVVFIDEAHNNFHTIDHGYQPFVKVLESDGYTVKRNKDKFSLESLEKVDILVISNALHIKNKENWNIPNYPAFQPQEVEAVYQWVKHGGSLLLIADHMPFPKASEALAAAFGFKFNNGYAFDPYSHDSIFSHTKGTLAEHPIIKGMDNTEVITQVKTFMGQAFQVPSNATSILIFGQLALSKMPQKTWDLNWETPMVSISGWSQGAALELMKGRVAVFGEASMFSSQPDEGTNESSGFMSVGAEQNEQFLLNVLHWLSHKI